MAGLAAPGPEGLTCDRSQGQAWAPCVPGTAARTRRGCPYSNMPSAAKSRPSTPRTMRLSEAGLTEILSVLHGGFCPPLEVHDKIAGEASIARPFGVGRICAVADGMNETQVGTELPWSEGAALPAPGALCHNRLSDRPHRR